MIRKNKMGMYVSHMDDAIRVIVPRDLHIGDEAFEAVEIGEKVEVEVKKSRFQVNDPYILSVGTFRSSKGKKARTAAARVPVAAPVAAPPAVEEEDEEEEGASEEGEELSDELSAAAEEEAAAD